MIGYPQGRPGCPGRWRDAWFASILPLPAESTWFVAGFCSRAPIGAVGVCTRSWNTSGSAPGYLCVKAWVFHSRSCAHSPSQTWRLQVVASIRPTASLAADAKRKGSLLGITQSFGMRQAMSKRAGVLTQILFSMQALRQIRGLQQCALSGASDRTQPSMPRIVRMRPFVAFHGRAMLTPASDLRDAQARSRH